jgi:hypothetical protein
MPCIDQVLVEFDPGHLGHIDVSNQADCLADTVGREKIGRRGESLDAVAKRTQITSHKDLRLEIALPTHGGYHERIKIEYGFRTLALGPSATAHAISSRIRT